MLTSLLPVPTRAALVEQALDDLLGSVGHLDPNRRQLLGWLALDVDAVLADAHVATTDEELHRTLARAEDLLADLVEVARTATTPIVAAGPGCAFDRMFVGATSSP